MAKQDQPSEQETTGAEPQPQPAVEILPMHTGVVQGRLEYGESLADNRTYTHGQLFTTHDKKLFDELMRLGALKSPTADAQAAEVLLAQKNVELDALKARIAELEAAARPRALGGR